MFSYSATAAGATNTGDGYLCEKDRPYPQRTIFDALLDAGHEYVRIYNDSSLLLCGIQIRAPHAIDAMLSLWSSQAIDATLSP